MPGKRVAALIACVLAATTVPAAADTQRDEPEIRRTADGIPHIRAQSWQGLGAGYGYVQAQAVLCTLAEGFVTFEGRRSFFFGENERPRLNSTFGRPTNLELDIFFRAFISEREVSQLRAKQPAELAELVSGFAAGYNRYLREARQHADKEQQRKPCLREPWVREISATDMYRRMHAAVLAGGYAKFIPELVNAQPPRTESSSAARRDVSSSLRARIGEHDALGSNMIAFGKRATSDGRTVLLANPHWFWSGIDRFFQAHLTIPGKLNVAGASFLGIPTIMIGFNEHVAWAHTVSTAARYGFFELDLDPTMPTAYRVDGVSEPMQQQRIEVPIRQSGGGTGLVVRTLYRTRFGPIVDVQGGAVRAGWTRQRAVALRDINAENFSAFHSLLRTAQARSLQELVSIQQQYAAMSWVNTAAIGRGDGRAWYGDIGAVPNVSDALRQTCSTPLAQSFATVNRIVPVLDGSRSSCNWPHDNRAKLPGAMPAQLLPSVFSETYVANMNDSYWLTDPRQPLKGYPLVLGGEAVALSLRGRQGHQVADSLLERRYSSAELSGHLQQEVLNGRSYAADQYKQALLGSACGASHVDVSIDVATGKSFSPARRVSVLQACEVLKRWPNNAEPTDRGSLLWDAFWLRVAKIPSARLFRKRFSATEPLTTPADPTGSSRLVAESLGAAVLALASQQRQLDAPRGTYVYVEARGAKVPIVGSCASAGYLAVACGAGDDAPMSEKSFGNTYLQVVRFGQQGVEAFTLIAHGLDEELGQNGTGEDALQRYARKDWLRMPFYESEIAADPKLTRMTLRR